MPPPQSDAFVFFGATGDLAYKKIFPALQAMIRHGELDIPIIGIARAGWSLDKLRRRARDSVANNGGIDEAAFAKLAAQLLFVDGDYSNPSTYDRLRKALGGAERLLHAPLARKRGPAVRKIVGDAIRGDPSLFTRDDSVEAAWRVVDPILHNSMPVQEYEPGTWGPASADHLVSNGEDWHGPAPETETTPEVEHE